MPGVRDGAGERAAPRRRGGRRGDGGARHRHRGVSRTPDLKIFLDAAVEVRAERRRQEHLAKGEVLELRANSGRSARARPARPRAHVSPLVRADDAVLVDNTAMDVEETARLIVLLARDRGAEMLDKGRDEASGKARGDGREAAAG